ncbi:IS110 family transposase [Verrucosispora sp. WMMA2044]|uniref:IS110 family transposase n=1 Tax=Verrucosispora sioxanthis TaxID=2499994 RepID=A0A6M1KR58_9ACTN|nr:MULTISPECIES: IS110 family transposase [Micromonospora]NEE63358.1 IS110 family transposase [Verrucosispora sioxanthis]NGM12468.1 IS110 family transposase [Verrucosispora sioxanthis]WBB46794.1 IS110 family transposase [Verrucosispora sp. WMMA2044]
MTAREVMWVGVDAGKQAHHAVAVDAEGRLLWSTRVANDQAAIEALVARAGRSGAEVCWAVDLTCAAATLLLALLVTAGQRVVYVPGRTVNRMAGAFAGEGKTDAKDARIIADTARLRRDLTELSTPNELVVEMSLLVAQRADLMGDWVRGVNRLRELLTAIFPALERTFDYTTRSALILVAGYQTPQAIREAGPDGLAAHLSEAGAWRKGIPSMVDKALAAAAAQTIRLPAEATTAALIARLARRLLDLDREIKDTDKLLTERFRTHPQAKIIESMPGMGPILGAEFLVATGGDLAAFGTSARLAAYAGLAPVPRDSGRRTGNLHRPKRYHRGLRRVFYMAALSSLRASGASQAYYRRKREERLRHTQALIALARRLVDVLWALLRDNRQFHDSPPLTARA